MKHCMARLSVLGLGAFLVGCQDQPTAPGGIAERTPAAGIQHARQYVVEFSDPAASQRVLGLVADFRGELAGVWEEVGLSVVKGISEADAEALRSIPGVESVTQDVIVRWIPELTAAHVVELDGTDIQAHDPSAAFFFTAFQWNMRQIEADGAWARGFEAEPTVKVAILDTGINTDHIDMADFSFIPGFTPIVDAELSRNMLSSTSETCASGGETLDPSNFDDFNFHGTHVGGIVNTNGLGTAGVAPHATLVAVKVLNCEGFGSFGDVIAGILYAARHRVDVINMSLGADIPNTREFKRLLKALTKAIDKARKAGVYVVAAAGNDARKLPKVKRHGELLSVPCQSSEDVACISATGPFDQMDFDRLASYSNFGKHAISVAAPGGDFLAGNVFDFILSPCSPSSVVLPDFGIFCGTGSYLFVVGTSQAAPHVAGAAALVDAQFGGALDGEEIKRIIEETADKVGSRGSFGRGRLNVLKALVDDGGV